MIKVQTRHYFTYIATNKLNTVLYVGVTSNLIKRIWQHKQKLVSSFTSRYNITKLVYFETYNDIKQAIAREKQLKAGSRQRKLDLIKSVNPDFNDLYDTLLG